MHDVAKTISKVGKLRRIRGPMGMAIGGLVLLIVILLGIKAMQIGKMMSSKMPMPVETVTSAVAKEEDWAPALSSPLPPRMISASTSPR